MKWSRCPARIRVLMALMVVVLLVAAGGCNTIEGVGKDLSGAGQGLADLAADINPDNN